MFKGLRYLTFVFGGLLGILLAYGFGQVVELELSKFAVISIYSIFAIIFGIIFYSGLRPLKAALREKNGLLICEHLLRWSGPVNESDDIYGSGKETCRYWPT